MARWLSRATLSVAERAGQADRLRAVHDALLPRDRWRNRRDERALRLLLATVLTERSSCVDVGAHRGSVLEEIVRVAPLGDHVAVEPLPDHAAALARRFPDVTVHGCAASDATGEATLVTWPEAPAYSSLAWVPPRPETRHVYPESDDAARTLTVRTAPLDALLPADLDVALIKIDVEGAETAVLDGAARTLERCRPVVALEHSLACLRHGACAGDDVYDRLSAAGLRLFSMEGDGPYTRDAFRAEVESNRRWFYFAAPA